LRSHKEEDAEVETCIWYFDTIWYCVID